MTASPLSKTRLSELAARPFEALRNHTERITVVRVPGTPALRSVRDYIVAELEKLQVFDVRLDSFNASTPHGVKDFHSIVATYNPGNKSRVVFSAHYDSKWYPEPNTFVAATDSAVPCAMLLDLAATFAESCVIDQASRGLQLVFFDGEEAFETWTDTDSTYGARHLAEQWQDEGHLDRVALFILLDLIGAPNPKFLNWWPSATGLQFRELSFLLRQLKRNQLLHDNATYKSYFAENRYYGAIEDDHIPFLRRGVPVVHLISAPFPSTWHTPGDNLASLDWDTTEDLMVVFRSFMASILDLTSAPNATQNEL